MKNIIEQFRKTLYFDHFAEKKNNFLNYFQQEWLLGNSSNLHQTIKALIFNTELNDLSKNDLLLLKKYIDKKRFYLQKHQDLSFYPTRIKNFRKKENTLIVCLLLTNMYC